MPKKTKKEKILAVYRKKLRLLEQANKSITTPSSTSEDNSRATETRTFEVKISQPTPPPKFFFLDLRKSLILIVLIIALEIGLYFARLIK